MDDVTVVTLADSPDGPRFCAQYKTICQNLNIKLAATCPKFEKSFEDSTKGTVLGIMFDAAHWLNLDSTGINLISSFEMCRITYAEKSFKAEITSYLRIFWPV